MQYLKEELDIKGGIKKFNNWFKFRDIHNICKKYGIKNYHINDDGTVDLQEQRDKYVEKILNK